MLKRQDSKNCYKNQRSSCLCPHHKCIGTWRSTAPPFLTSTLDGERSDLCLVRFYHGGRATESLLLMDRRNCVASWSFSHSTATEPPRLRNVNNITGAMEGSRLKPSCSGQTSDGYVDTVMNNLVSYGAGNFWKGRVNVHGLPKRTPFKRTTQQLHISWAGEKCGRTARQNIAKLALSMYIWYLTRCYIEEVH